MDFWSISSIFLIYLFIVDIILYKFANKGNELVLIFIEIGDVCTSLNTIMDHLCIIGLVWLKGE